MFEWKTQYSIDVPKIDQQHQNLFGMAAELHTAMAAGRGTDVLDELLGRLVAYTEVHFAQEENLMRQCAYPDLAAHRKLHEAFSRQVRAYQADFTAGKTSVTIELLHFFTDWLKHHIAAVDRNYAPYYNSAPVTLLS